MHYMLCYAYSFYCIILFVVIVFVLFMIFFFFFFYFVVFFIFFFFFFFQAEDGIRDGTVTGVQTCALPIYITVGIRVHFFKSDPSATTFTENATLALNAADYDKVLGHVDIAAARSEERRVGKECRSRWSRDH